MVKTIGNPLSWIASQVGGAGAHLADVSTHLGSEAAYEEPKIRHLTTADLREALKAGVNDFGALRTDVIFVALIYPVVGLVLAWLAFNRDLMHLVFPVMSGFALIGPFAAIGLYELSRRREVDGTADWLAALQLLRSPALGAVILLGLFHVAIFAVWVGVANLIYSTTLGPEPPASAGAFLDALTLTSAGWTMIVTGLVAGAAFAVLVLATSVVSFPLLLDRDVGVPVAIATSVRVARANPVIIGLWGLIVALLLAIGSLPALLGLIVVMPVLGHATWHLYRRAVE
ncbi:MAG: DUF2189 domain-containing protein [Paracoccaceae bacterium]